MSEMPWPWEANDAEEAYAVWQAHVEAGADAQEPDWRGPAVNYKCRCPANDNSVIRSLDRVGSPCAPTTYSGPSRGVPAPQPGPKPTEHAANGGPSVKANPSRSDVNLCDVPGRRPRHISECIADVLRELTGDD